MAVAIAVTGIYLALSVAAAGCLFLHSSVHHFDNHHSEPGTHSPLCAWACQVTSEGMRMSFAPAAVPGAVSITSVIFFMQPLPTSPSFLLPPRAPPVFTLG
jgi:hypothetical protein